jgi:cell division protease FtsH
VRGREAVLNIHLRGKPAAPDVNPSLVARQTPGFAGADLANLVNEAALHAARRGDKRIGMRHFSEALDKIVLGTERPVLMTEHDRKVIAYHEAGHALVGTLLPEGDPVAKVTIIPRGRALGVTQYAPEGDRYNYSRQRLLTQLSTLLGGRAAEIVAIGEITTGAENDLQRATQLARSMIGRWGMSEEVGLLFADEHNDNPFLGREMAGPRQHSEATAARLDNTVRALLDERMELTLKTLKENQGILDRIAGALLEFETIDQAGLMAAIRGDEIPPPSLDWGVSSPVTPPPTPPAPPQPRPGLLPS